MAQAIAGKCFPEGIEALMGGGSPAEGVGALQAMYLSPPKGMDASLLDKIMLLTTHKDMGVRFWAKKIFRKYSFQFYKDEPDQFASGEAEETLSLDVLSKMLRDVRKSKFLAIKVLKKICNLNSPQALELLLKYLKTTDDPFQISFLTKNLGVHFPSDHLIPGLTPFLSNQDDRVIANTIEGLEAIGSPKCFEIISRFLKHRSNRVRANAAKAIANFDSGRAFDILMKMLASKGQPHLIISACHTIRELKDPKFFPYLQQLLNDDLVLDDILDAMVAINDTRTEDVLCTYIEKAETRISKIRSILETVPSKKSIPAIIIRFYATPFGKRLAEVDWTEFFFSRKSLVIEGVVFLAFILVFWIGRYQNPVIQTARQELAKRHLSFSNPQFFRSLETKDLRLIELFLAAGADANARSESGSTPIHVAAYSGDLQLLEKLLTAGADVNAVDGNGLSALHLAATRDVAEVLLRKGALSEIRDNKGRTPLHRAAENGRNEIIELLQAKGGDINAQSKDGDTPLHLALKNRKPKTANLLISLGANVKIRNQQGISPVDIGIPQK
ncbi:MAG: ankyrin repeat domain-containing protein [Candidatus Riflebacteria bacterium]|nr:ankyrin repeat domain-containing protein [Candidatus Riflebacteria bacterium]